MVALCASTLGPAAEVLERMKSSMRVEPDRRFIAALGRLHTFVPSAPAPAASVHYENDAWHVRLGDADAGKVSELPPFVELFALVQAHAKTVWEASGLHASKAAVDPAAALPLIAPLEVGSVLRETDAQ